jgi:benzoyl-CoA reductase/2-hydroxyglutaryl-CoA dehydratase subunit BcrC/BadD/HgdB
MNFDELVKAAKERCERGFTEEELKDIADKLHALAKEFKEKERQREIDYQIMLNTPIIWAPKD